MNHLSRNLLLLWRTERTLGQAQLRLSSRKTVLAIAAGIAVLFAMAMLNISAFFALESAVGKAQAALFVAVADFVFAGVMLMTANYLKPAPEEEMVREVRAMALAEIEAEVEGVQQQLVQIRDDVRGMRHSLVSFMQHPIDRMAAGAVVPAISALTKVIRSTNSAKK